MKIYHGSFSECGPRKNNEDYIAVRQMHEQVCMAMGNGVI